MYISDLTETKKNRIINALEKYDISYEFWDDGILNSTLFIPDTKNITLSLGGAFDTINFLIDGKCVEFITLYKNEYYQLVW